MSVKKGNIPWNKGKKGMQVAWNKGMKGLQDWHNIDGLGKGFHGKHSDETKEKISKKLQGRAQPWNQGEKSNFWKGGKTKKIDSLRQSKEYREWRRKVYERDDYTCQICFIRGGTLEADHIKPKALFLELIFDVNNGRTLCRDCHRKTETYGVKTIEYV